MDDEAWEILTAEAEYATDEFNDWKYGTDPDAEQHE
jgi:hypothetical protein